MKKKEAMEIDVEVYYRRYGPMVLRRCRWLLKDEDSALDAMQDVFVQVLRHREKLRDEYPSSLLYKIATNICLNKIRSKKRSPESENSDILERIAFTDSFENRVYTMDVLDRIFKREKESTRLIAVMHLVDGMTLDEVSKETGLSVSGVRKRLRGLKKRASIFKEHCYEE